MLWPYSHFTGSGIGSGTGTGSGTGYGSGDIAWYRYCYQIALVVLVPVGKSVPVGF